MRNGGRGGSRSFDRRSNRYDDEDDRPRRRRYDDDDDRPRRRHSDDDDDRPRRFTNDRSDDGPAWITLENRLFGSPLVRLFWRPAGQRGGWSENVLPRTVYPGRRVQFSIPQGNVDLCVELPDGTAGWWENRNVGRDGLSIWAQGDPRRDFAYRTPCRMRDRRR
jgi:hypothetical protein